MKSVLKECTLFSEADDASLELTIHYGKMKLFSPGETIYIKGELARGKFAVMLSGRVGIIAANGQIVRGMGRGEVLGDVGVASPQQKRSLTVRVVQPTEILEWDVNTLKNVVPDVIKKLKTLAWKNVSNYMDN